MIYTEKELETLRSQIKKRWIILAVPVVLLIALLVATLVIRSQRIIDDTTGQIICDIASIMIGVLLIGGYGLFIKPIRCYARHVDQLLHGLTHTYDKGSFSHYDMDESVIDGVHYYGVTLKDVDDKGKQCEHVYYYDALKPRPEIAEGTPVSIVYHDRFIGSIEGR